MSLAILTEEEERVAAAPHWSHSRIDKYLRCPEQYRLHYVEGYRPRLPAASLVFGHVMHQALAALFRDKADPVAFFQRAWGNLKQVDLTYAAKEPWEKLRDMGEKLLQSFVENELHRFGAIAAVEKAFTLTITNFSEPFVGVIDLVGEVEGKNTILDFKTAQSAYPNFEVSLNDQLTAYELAEPQAEQAALCVLVKVKEPRIDWHFSSRGAEHLTDYLAKVEMVARDIAAGHFYRRPGKHCSYCDFLPVCLGDQAKARETLVRIDPR